MEPRVCCWVRGSRVLAHVCARQRGEISCVIVSWDVWDILASFLPCGHALPVHGRGTRSGTEQVAPGPRGLGRVPSEPGVGPGWGSACPQEPPMCCCCQGLWLVSPMSVSWSDPRGVSPAPCLGASAVNNVPQSSEPLTVM